MTSVEMLAAVEAAIEKILSGAQEYQLGSRRVRRGDLPGLLQERRRLLAEVATDAGYQTTVATFDQR